MWRYQAAVDRDRWSKTPSKVRVKRGKYTHRSENTQGTEWVVRGEDGSWQGVGGRTGLLASWEAGLPPQCPWHLHILESRTQIKIKMPSFRTRQRVK